MTFRDISWNKIWGLYHSAKPFNHVVIDNFFLPEIADKLSEEFPDYNDPSVSEHISCLENKKTNNQWNKFPPCTYRTFFEFGKESFLKNIRDLTSCKDLVFDYGLHGGGWHMHTRGGNNNVHLDYNIHPKTGLQRKVNIIVYLTKDWKKEWGGGLELWSHDFETNQPKACEKVVDNIFNRAIIFDTTQNSWHGLPNQINCPEGVIRKSLAAYYLQPAPAITENRGRALFSPREDQKNDSQVYELIKQRSTKLS